VRGTGGSYIKKKLMGRQQRGRVWGEKKRMGAGVTIVASDFKKQRKKVHQLLH